MDVFTKITGEEKVYIYRERFITVHDIIRRFLLNRSGSTCEDPIYGSNRYV